jgi:hypothetical protein
MGGIFRILGMTGLGMSGQTYHERDPLVIPANFA